MGNRRQIAGKTDIYVIFLSMEVATISFEDPVSDFYSKYNSSFRWVFFHFFFQILSLMRFWHLASVWNL